MKKSLIVAAAALAMIATGCSKSSDAADSTSAIDALLCDSISICYGKNVGNYLLRDFGGGTPEVKSTQGRADVIKGIQMVLGQTENRDYIIGMQVGVQLANEIAQLEEMGITINRTEFINNLKQALMADTISQVELQDNGFVLMHLMERAQQQINESKEAERQQEPEAVQNGIAGKAYVDKVIADNPNTITTDSGLTVVITEAGTGAKPTLDDQVLVNYTGRLIDGTVFDSTDGRGPAIFPLAGVVPGFSEGIMMLATGGKATLYIPGNLAYGANGQPAAGIGPNMTLVFDVELLEINPNAE